MIFSSKCTIKHLAVELRPNPLKELTALPQSPSWIEEGNGDRGTEGRISGRRSEGTLAFANKSPPPKYIRVFEFYIFIEVSIWISSNVTEIILIMLVHNSLFYFVQVCWCLHVRV